MDRSQGGPNTLPIWLRFYVAFRSTGASTIGTFAEVVGRRTTHTHALARRAAPSYRLTLLSRRPRSPETGDLPGKARGGKRQAAEKTQTWICSPHRRRRPPLCGRVRPTPRPVQEGHACISRDLPVKAQGALGQGNARRVSGGRAQPTSRCRNRPTDRPPDPPTPTSAP